LQPLLARHRLPGWRCRASHNTSKPTRGAKQRFPSMTLGPETAHDGRGYFGSSVQLPTLTLPFCL